MTISLNPLTCCTDNRAARQGRDATAPEDLGSVGRGVGMPFLPDYRTLSGLALRGMGLRTSPSRAANLGALPASPGAGHGQGAHQDAPGGMGGAGDILTVRAVDMHLLKDNLRLVGAKVSMMQQNFWGQSDTSLSLAFFGAWTTGSNAW